MKKLLVVISGPTASGKTDLGLFLAKALMAEIISADSRQFFKEMNIGTAKPDTQELTEIKHHFINLLSVNQEYSAGDFERDVIPLLAKLHKSSDVVLMVGGSGLYIDAVCRGLDEFPEIREGIRTELQEKFEKSGLEPLLEILKEKDPETYEIIDKNNNRRVIRALEVCISSGRTYSSFKQKNPKPRAFKILKIGINISRDKLYEMINNRVDSMMESGLLEEAKTLYTDKSSNALQTVGYRELFDYFDGKTTLQDAIALIKRNTRRYAKRQMTWFGNDESIHWYPADRREEILTFIRQNLPGI